MQKPLMYYDNNIIGLIALLEAMAAHGCKKVVLQNLPFIPLLSLFFLLYELGFFVVKSQLVFSSSATVYGWPKVVPCNEESPICALNPYGSTKVTFWQLCCQYLEIKMRKELWYIH